MGSLGGMEGEEGWGGENVMEGIGSDREKMELVGEQEELFFWRKG